jgi:hypothetical protein
VSHPRRLTALLATAAAFVLPASAAHAGLLVASSTACDAQSSSSVFAPWLDPAQYVLAPGGAAESADGWSLDGGAAITSGNEPWSVRDASDGRALTLPPGASATTSPMCVGIEHPDLRFFARSSGSAFGSLRVEALVETASGDLASVPVGSVGTGGWAATAIMPLVASLLPLLPGDHTPVAFRFTAYGPATFSLDDVYVDPYGKR